MRDYSLCAPFIEGFGAAGEHSYNINPVAHSPQASLEVDEAGGVFVLRPCG
jgi:hypothetical protein